MLPDELRIEAAKLIERAAKLDKYKLLSTEKLVELKETLYKRWRKAQQNIEYYIVHNHPVRLQDKEEKALTSGEIAYIEELLYDRSI